jgi:hypothetical protein
MNALLLDTHMLSVPDIKWEHKSFELLRGNYRPTFFLS